MEDERNTQSWGPTVLRVVVGTVFLMHGGQKIFTFGLHGTAGFLGGLGVPMPAVMAAILIAVEFLGGAALVLGVFTRWAAMLLAVDMMVAIVLVHLKNGFFMPAGVELALTLMAACIALAIMGAGPASVDNFLSGRE
jgi:putative oxidoreductase